MDMSSHFSCFSHTYNNRWNADTDGAKSSMSSAYSSILIQVWCIHKYYATDNIVVWIPAKRHGGGDQTMLQQAPCLCLRRETSLRTFAVAYASPVLTLHIVHCLKTMLRNCLQSELSRSVKISLCRILSKNDVFAVRKAVPARWSESIFLRALRTKNI